MIRRYGFLFRACLMLADAGMASVGILAANRFRFGNQSLGQTAMDRALPDPTVFMAAFVAAWVILLWSRGLYRSRARWTVRGDGVEILKADVTLIALTLSVLFLLKLPDVSRLFLLVVFPLLAIVALAVRIALRLVLRLMREHGRNVRYMLILGSNARAEAFADLVESHSELGLVVVGHLRADESDNGVHLKRPDLGLVDDLETVLHERVVDEVAICLPFRMEGLIEESARLCEEEGKVVRIPVAPVERVLTMGRLESVDGIGVYSLANGPDKVIGLAAKRLIDFVLSTSLLILLSPVLLLIGIAVKLGSPGGVLFRQERLGLHGRPFQVVKFRTMCSDAEQRLDALRELNAIQGHAFKLDNDPRVTRVGGFLRRSSLDELPQLWNVLRGQMSLVGPRPPLPTEVANYNVWHRRRLSMKPGITGLWQVDGRRSAVFDQWVEHDLRYIDEWSLWLDLKILARTLPAVISGTGR